MRSLNTHEHVSKQLPNSPILRNNHELDNIMVNKGQVHKDLKEYFLGVFEM